MLALLSSPAIEPKIVVAQNQEITPQYGGTLRLGWYRKPAPFNPFETTDTISSAVMDLIFDKLIHLNENAEFESDLAKRWEISEDGLTYTFYLRRGVKFHDGTELTSRDVLYTFKLLSDREISPGFYRHFDAVREWSAPADDIFRIVLKEPFQPFLLSLWYGNIIPAHALKDPKNQLKAFSGSPIGSGPFAFINQDKNGNIELKAHKDYFQGRPYLDKVQVKIFPTKSQVWSAFLRDELDVLFYLDRRDYEEIKENPNFRFFRYLPSGGYVLSFNLEDPLLSNSKIRQAISLSINRQEIVEKIEGGEGVLLDGPFYPRLWPRDQENEEEVFNPDQALALLAQEGYQIQNGILEREGKPLVLDLLVDPENEHQIQIAKMIRQQLQEVGVRMQLSYLSSPNPFLDSAQKNKFAFQCYLFLFNTGIEVYPDVASHYWGSHGRFNFGHYRNKEVDHLLDLARKTRLKPETTSLYRKVNKLIAKDQPAVFLYIPYIFHGTSRQISHFENLASGPLLPFYRLKEVSKIKTKEKEVIS